MTDPDSNRPVLEDACGPFYGDVLTFDPDNPEQVFPALPEGEYVLEAVFRDSTGYSTSENDKNLWNYVSNIKIEKGKDTVITISNQ